MNQRGMTNMNQRKSDKNIGRACRTERIPQAARTIACALALLAGGTLSAGDLVLVSPGRRTCAVVVDGEVFSPCRDADRKRAKEAESRKRLRESAEDLAATLEKVTGGSVAVITNAALLAGRTPVYVGAAAERVFGPCGVSAPFRQGLRVIVDAKRGVGLYGESDLAASYAVYTFLHNLGCRWFFPGELGEVLPKRATLAVAEQDVKTAPYTYYRSARGYYTDETFERRNRIGGGYPPTQHCLESYADGAIKDHPEWRATDAKGNPVRGRLKWSNRELADYIGGVICERQRKNPQDFYCLSPNDGWNFDDSPEDRALDTGDFDPTFQMTSITDRAVTFYNRIVERAVREFPDLKFCALAYVQYTRPPLKVKPHKNLVIQLAPITYSRAHPMNMLDVPDNDGLRYIVDGWGSICKTMSYYYYGYFLAAPLSTYPCLRKWAYDVKAAFEKGSCRYWQPESFANAEFFAMAQWMGLQMAWDPSQDPWKLLKEANDALYAPAADEMWTFWNEVDKLWVETPEYSGGGWGHLNRFKGGCFERLMPYLDRAAAKAAGNEKALRRIGLARRSWELTRGFCELRQDLREGRWLGLQDRTKALLASVTEAASQNAEFHCFSYSPWDRQSRSFACAYFNDFYGRTHQGAAELATNATLLASRPVTVFRYKACAKGDDAAPRPASLDETRTWPTTDVMLETWSTIGLHNHLGAVRYQATVDLAAVPKGKKAFVWLGATDGSAQVWLNGKPLVGRVLPFPGDWRKFTPSAAPSAFGRPIAYEATDAAKAGKNVLDIFAVREAVNEVGTGGLLGPVTVYAEK